MYITEEELNMLEKTASEAEWNAACDQIKIKYGGYPQDWFAKVNMSGLMARVARRWNKPDAFDLKITTYRK